MTTYKDALNELSKVKFDFLTFLSGDTKNEIQIMASDYNNAGEPVGGSEMGDMYHIMLFRDHKEQADKYDDLDMFEAILVEPAEYVARLIPAGFYGIIGRKTTTSSKVMEKLVDNFNKINYN